MKHDAFRRIMGNPETSFHLFFPDKLRRSIPISFLWLLLIILLPIVSIQDVMAQAPTATTDAATGIGSTSVTVNGTVNPSGDQTIVFFEYGLTVEYGSTIAAQQSPITGSTDTPVSADLSLLDPLATFHYRVGATNASGTTYGADMTFTTLASSGGNPPTVITDPASGTGVNFTTLNGQIYTYNINTTVIFQWGTDTGYGNTITAEQSPVNSASLIPVTATLSGLNDNTTYHYRITASNDNGTVYGQDMTFSIGTGGTAPTTTSNAATGITTQAATLNGTVNANGDTTVISFEYGIDTNYGNTVPADQNPVSGSTDTPVSVNISNFSPNTTYHYRVVATNSYGSTNGADLSFTTLPSPPTTTTEAASSVTSSSGVLNGTVNANGASTIVTFEYGIDTGYGLTVTADQSQVTGSVDTAVNKIISGLTDDVTYHYRVVGVNSGGTTYGEDMTFTAGAAAATVVTDAASAITSTSAIFNGSVNAKGNSATVLFEYGTTIDYDRSTIATQSPVTGT
ncbi:MAG: hypothetical protein OEM02_07655, partial [Desulfobulbaceae bacterium]|nr:hypothetical protein [Desulfobulbaceae bacterium]